jgi:RNA polymerase sigma factor (sigma-70 family)
MSTSARVRETRSSGRHSFAATRWTVVLTAGHGLSPQAGRALEELCRTYWYPLYAYVRRRGHNPQEAEDLTQEFFARLLARNYLAGVDREKGKFRSFLLASLKHFLANEWDRAQAQKRGGGQPHLSLDTQTAETRYQSEPADDLTPEKLLERRWALALLDQVLARLRAEFVADDKEKQFDELKVWLTEGKGATSYAVAAARLGTTEGAAKVAVHRLRRRYRELLRDEISHTVATPAEIEEEIRHLFAAFAS